MKLTDVREEADVCLYAVVQVISRSAHDEVVGSRLKTVSVEQSGDARRGHAAPVVGLALKQSNNGRNLCVGCNDPKARRGGIICAEIERRYTMQAEIEAEGSAVVRHALPAGEEVLIKSVGYRLMNM